MLAILDGMGGLQDGELSAEIASHLVSTAFVEALSMHELVHRFDAAGISRFLAHFEKWSL